MSPELRAKILKYKSDNFKKDLPKYEGGGYGINMGSTGSMVNMGINALSSFIPEGQQVSGNFTDSEAAQKQNVRTDRLNKASKGLGAAAGAASLIPGVGWIAGAGLGLASLGTKIGAAFSGKKADEQETVTYAKDGGWLKGYESTITNLPDNMAAWSYQDGGPYEWSKGVDTKYEIKNPVNSPAGVRIKQPKSEVEKALEQRRPTYNHLTGEGQIATGAIEESMSPIDLIGSGLYSGGVKLLAKGAKNTYKINPWAFKPKENSAYRMIGGKEGYLDAITSGEIRAAPGSPYKDAHFNMGQPLNPNRMSKEDLIKAGSPEGYPGPYMVEKRWADTGWNKLSLADSFKDNPQMQKIFKELGKDKDVWGKYGNVKTDDIATKIYKEHWLHGYKEVPKKEHGGSLINFKGNKHSEGGINIDQNMRVNNTNPVANVEGEETGDPKQNYIFSDTLKPMKSKVTFADLSKKIDNKYKDKTDAIATNSKDKELARLAQQNEAIRLAKESKNPLKMKGGGKLPKYYDGGTPPFVEGYNRDGMDYLKENPAINYEYNPFNVTVPPVEKSSWLDRKATPEEILNVSTSTVTPDMSGERFGATQRRMAATSPTTTTPTESKFGMTTGDKMQLGAGALTGITNLAMGLKKPQKFDPINLQDNGMQHIKDVRFNPNEILMNRNVAASQINQSTGSNAARIANLQSLYRGTNTQLGELAQKEALANVEQGNRRAQTAFGTSQFNAGASERARGLNNQARQAAQDMRATGLEQIYASVGNVGKGMNERQTNDIKMNVLNSIAGQYGIDSETYKIIYKQLMSK